MEVLSKNLYRVGKDLVEAVRSPGGRFYDVTVLATGGKFRILAEIFERHVKEVKDETQKRERPPQA